MMVILDLSSSSVMDFESILSIKIAPFSISTILLIAKLMVLFPAPVLPTMPTFYPPSILKFRPLRTKSVFGRYLSSTSLNSIDPTLPHFSSFYASCSDMICFSCGISNNLKILCAEIKHLSIWLRLCSIISISSLN